MEKKVTYAVETGPSGGIRLRTLSPPGLFMTLPDPKVAHVKFAGLVGPFLMRNGKLGDCEAAQVDVDNWDAALALGTGEVVVKPMTSKEATDTAKATGMMEVMGEEMSEDEGDVRVAWLEKKDDGTVGCVCYGRDGDMVYDADWLVRSINKLAKTIDRGRMN